VGIRLIARDTVAVETFARLAISRISICKRPGSLRNYHERVVTQEPSQKSNQLLLPPIQSQ
jgi:hypothetical protein